MHLCGLSSSSSISCQPILLMKPTHNSRYGSLPVEGCQGYDAVFGDVRNVAVWGQRSVEGGSVMEMHYKVCQGMEEVRSTLQIEQSSILGHFKAGNHHVSDKLRFFNSLNLTTHSVAIVLFAKIVSGGHTITDASLAVTTPQTPDEVQDFVRVHGDSYVTKVVMGAEYYASFTYYATTRGEKLDLLEKMRKDGVFSWGSGDSSFDRKIAKFNSVQNVSLEFHQAMRGISGIALPEPTRLVNFVLKLPTLTIDKPQILHSESVGYEHARGFQVPYFACVMRNRSLIVEDPSFLSLLSQVKGLETDVQAIEAMLRQYGMYTNSARSFLDEVKGALKVDTAAVQDMLQEYKDDAMQNELRPSAFKSLEYVERVQSSYWTEVQSMYLGGNGGGARDYVTNIVEFMSTRRRIVSIQLRSGRWIDRITIRYSNSDKFECGGIGGSCSNILHVPEGIYFSKIRIKDNGHYISFLEFVLTNGNSLCGGDVESGGGQDITYEPYTAPEYHYFCGFQARSGMYIDGVRAIFAKFEI